MKVLVALSDLSDEPSDPIAAVASFPWPEGSEIHVLSVAEMIQPAMVGMGPDAIDLANVQLDFKDEARHTVARATARLRRSGFQAEGITLEGAPETAIIDHAKTWGADLIVVGMRDRSLLERLLLSSISEGVVKHAPCSVLVIKHGPAA